jgi:hypothetical protein
MSYACNDPHTAYVNSGNSGKNITVEISEHCGGSTDVYIVKPSGDVTNRTTLQHPGGSVALHVEPGDEVHVFCEGGNDEEGCKVEVR